jgi:flagellar basal-body rod modification protein FlgD
MAIQSTTTTTAAVTGTTAPAAAAPNKGLGKDDFLKLMIAQMKNQDPMNPTDSTQSIAQMAQFSSLEQITNLANATQELASRMTLTQNVGLLGHTVTYLGTDGAAVTGTVDGLDLAPDGSASLSVAGQAGIDPTTVTTVR